jgi:nucleoid-associated protein YgaU
MAKEMKIGLIVICVLVFVFGVALVWRLRHTGPAAEDTTAAAPKKAITSKASKKKPASKTLTVKSAAKAPGGDHKHEHTHIHSVGHSHDRAKVDRYSQPDVTYDPSIQSSRYGLYPKHNSDDMLQGAQQPAQLRIVDGGRLDRYAQQFDTDPATSSTDGHHHDHTYTPNVPRRRLGRADQFQQSAQNAADQTAQNGGYDARYPQPDSYAPNRYGLQRRDSHRHSPYEQTAQADNLPQQQADYGPLENDYYRRHAIEQTTPTSAQAPVSALQKGLRAAGYSGDGPGKHAQLHETGTYLVKPNDNFWTISEAVYGTGSYFKALIRHNDERHPLPERLSVGDEVLVPPEATLRENYPQLCPKPRRRSAAYAAPSSAPSGGRTYEVKEGDTLFDIAKYELGNPARWVEIYQLNLQLLTDDFDFVKPGLQLVLPGRGGTGANGGGGGGGEKYREDRLTEQPAPSVRR